MTLITPRILHALIILNLQQPPPGNKFYAQAAVTRTVGGQQALFTSNAFEFTTLP